MKRCLNRRKKEVRKNVLKPKPNRTIDDAISIVLRKKTKELSEQKKNS